MKFCRLSAHKLELSDINIWNVWKKSKNSTDVPVTPPMINNFWNKRVESRDSNKRWYIVCNAYLCWILKRLNAVPWTEKLITNGCLHQQQIGAGESVGLLALLIAMAMKSNYWKANEEAQKSIFDAYRQCLKDHRNVSFYLKLRTKKWKGGEDKPRRYSRKKLGGLFSLSRNP